MFLVRVRTMVKNRIQALLAPSCTPTGELLETLGGEVRATESWLRQATQDDKRVELLRTIPGLGELLACVVTLEIHRTERFANAAKLSAYAGLVPTTYASGGHTFHGRADAAKQQVAALGAGGSGLGGGQARPLLPGPLRKNPRA